MKVKIIVAFVLSLVLSPNVFSNIYTVTSANGGATNAGSLKKAIVDAAGGGRDTIRFNVPGNEVTLGWGEIEIPNAASDLFFDGVNPVNGNSVTLKLTLRSKATKVDFYGVRFDKSSFHALIITRNNNSIDSCFFTTSGNQMNSVWISGGNNTDVTNSVFTGSDGHAISIENGGGHIIDNCTTTGIKDVAIIIRGTGANTVSNCSTSAGFHNGIGLIAPNNIVENCVSFNNSWAGIVCDNWNGGCNGNIIRNNEVYGNNTDLGAFNPEQGAIASNGPDTEIYGNIIYDNGANGILINKVNGNPCDNQIVKDNIVGRDSNGNELGNGWNGIFVWKVNGANVEENIVVNNGNGNSHNSRNMPDRISGIRVQEVTSGTIQKNYVGTDVNKTNAGNAFDGITLHTNVTGITVKENISCYNGFNANPVYYGAQGGGGVAVRNNSGNNVKIESNFIGVHEDLTDGGNKDYGVSAEGAENLTIGGDDVTKKNVIGYTKNLRNSATSFQGCGIWLAFGATKNSKVYNNQIINNGGPGILINQGARKNIVGALNKGNQITSNEFGILVNSSGATDNTLRYNSFSCNTSGGISLQNGGNNEYGNAGSPKGVIVSSDELRANYVSGYAPSANASVDIYTEDTSCAKQCQDPVNQGFTLVATVSAQAVASPNGLFAWEYDFVTGGNLVSKDNVIVLATELGPAGSVNTSEFSVCHFECDTPTNSAITSPDFNLCPGEVASLNANSSGISSPGYTYNWYLGSISPSNLKHSVVDDASYNTGLEGDYIVVIANNIDPVGCADTSALATVIRNSNPIIGLDPSKTSLCSGEIINLDANATGSNLTYKWSPGNETSSSINISSDGNYGVTVTNSVTGCDTSRQITITEFKISQNLSINSSDFSLCPGETTTLTANATGFSSTDAYTYTWYLNSIAPSNVVKPSSVDSVLENASNGNYFVVVSNSTSGNDCVDTSALATVVKNSNPAINLVPSSNSLCSDGSINIDANASSGLSFLWSPSGQTSSDIDVTSGGDYGVTVTNSVTGCDTSAQVTITEYKIPDDLTINASDLSLCRGESATLTANASGLSGVNGYTYTWYLSAISSGNVVHTSSIDSTYTVKTQGDYFVVISNDASSGSCFDTSAVSSLIVKDIPSITVFPLPELCLGDTISLGIDLLGPNLLTSWSPGGATTTSIDVFEGGVFSATVTNSITGCDTVADLTVVEKLKPDVTMQNISFCQNDSVLVSAGISDMDYSWTPIVKTVESFYIYKSDTLIVKVTDPSTGCFTIDTVEAIQSPEPKPILELPLDTSMCPSEGDEIEINATVTSNLSGVLTWSDGTVDENSILAVDTIEFWAMYVDSFGCESSDTISILGECIPPNPKLPNVMTRETPWHPFGDISEERVLNGTLVVYNRWGRMVFVSEEKIPKWKGFNMENKECSAGVYFWIWEFNDNTRKKRTYNGYVQMLE